MHRSPNLNIFRDPRWGRGAETFGEDPTLVATLASALIDGLQGVGAAAKNTSYVKILAVPKHFAAYSLEEAEGQSRFWFNAVVSAQDMSDTYLPAWKAVVDAGARGVMCSYNELNGTPMCANRFVIDVM